MLKTGSHAKVYKMYHCLDLHLAKLLTVLEFPLTVDGGISYNTFKQCK